MKIRENVPIAELTTMRLGGNARYVFEIENPTEIGEAYRFAKEKALPVWVMGGGANTIGRDEGFEGVILLNRVKGIYAKVNDDFVEIDALSDEQRKELGEKIILRAMGGEEWDKLVEAACELGYSGIEAMSKIPGTVGAAPVQNIGAYGQDVSQVIERADVYDTEMEKIIVLEKPEMQMGYRKTRFNAGADAGRFLIVAVEIKLKKGELKPPFYNSLQRYIDEHNETDFSPKNIRRMVSEIRDGKLPDPEKIASAGSFFKNVYVGQKGADEAEKKGIPIWRNEDGTGKINSGWLIENCGLKGKTLHGFKISDKAALVLINENAKTYADLAQARHEIVEAVKDKFGYTLDQEPVELVVENKK